jgi:ribonuclease P protein component
LAKLTKTQKLLTKKEFGEVFNNNIRVYGKYFYSIVSLSNSPAKMGVIVSKKNHKLAVRRNQIKRVVREYFRLNYADIINANIIFIAKKFDNYNNKNLRADLSQLTSKINEIPKKTSDTAN